MHPITILMFFTLAMVLIIGGWALLSTIRGQQKKKSGIGGPNDPMA